MTTKYNIEDARRIALERGYTLLTEEYVNTSQKLLLQRNDKDVGHLCSISLGDLKRGRNCVKCTGKRRKKYTIEEIRKIVEAEGYTLVSTEYVDNKGKLDMICNREEGKHECSMSLNSFLRKERCGKCAPERQKKTMMEKYGVECPFNIPAVREKTTKAIHDKYGPGGALSDPTVRQKIIDKNMENHGVMYPLQSEEIREKGKETNMERYGVTNTMQRPIIQEKVKATNLERYGTESTLAAPEVREKIRNTHLERRGVDNPMKDPEIARKMFESSFSSKEYRFPSGRTEFIQGYEPFCIDQLLKEGYNESNIRLGKEVPVISYVRPDGKDGVYFPDMYLSDINTLVEVKSTWTYSIEPEKIMAKIEACREKGYNVRLYVYNGKKECVTFEEFERY